VRGDGCEKKKQQKNKTEKILKKKTSSHFLFIFFSSILLFLFLFFLFAANSWQSGSATAPRFLVAEPEKFRSTGSSSTIISQFQSSMSLGLESG